MGWIGNAPSQGLFNGGQIVDGTVDTVDLKDNAVTAQKLSSTAIKDKLATDQFLAVPRGTTAQRPSSPEIGYTRYNTELLALENYTENGWLKVSIQVPSITSISGTIYNSITTSLNLVGTFFGTQAGVVRFTSGAVTKDVTVTPTSTTSLNVAVPSEIYNLSAGSIVTIKFINSDNGVSNSIDRVSVGLPSGGTTSISSGYKYHTFLSSSSLIVPTGFSISADYLIVAGGGSGGGYFGGNYEGGAGGAGGMLTGSVSLPIGTNSIIIGGGGTAADGNANTSGANTTAIGLTAIGGGAGGAGTYAGASGGSGGGSGWISMAARDALTGGGSGTSGQGNAGGSAGGTNNGGGGGGGKATSGGHGSTQNGIGGSGAQWVNGSYYAGGGGGGRHPSGNTGGIGGGGNGQPSSVEGPGTPGTSNTGGGGGGGWKAGINSPGSNGGSGIVIIRYQLPT